MTNCWLSVSQSHLYCKISVFPKHSCWCCLRQSTCSGVKEILWKNDQGFFITSICNYVSPWANSVFYWPWRQEFSERKKIEGNRTKWSLIRINLMLSTFGETIWIWRYTQLLVILFYQSSWTWDTCFAFAERISETI